MPMSEADINRVLRKVWALTTTAGMTIDESIELHARGLISCALNSTGGDPAKAAELIKSAAADIVKALVSQGVKVSHVVREKAPETKDVPPPPPRRRRHGLH